MKLTDEVQTSICTIIKEGVWPETAARLAGVSERTYYRWKKAGEDQESGRFRNFLDAVEKAEAELEQGIVKDLLANMQPRDSLNFLKLRFKKYKDSSAVELTGANGSPIELATVVIHEKSDDDIRREQEAKRVAEKG